MQQYLFTTLGNNNRRFLHHYFHISSAKIIIFVHNEC